MSRVLMCAPRHYAIKYEINPWMKVSQPVKTTLARRQWEGLYQALCRLGVDVVTVPQHKDCPDMVFTANAGVVSGRLFIPSHFRYVERQAETAVFTRFFKKRGYTIVDLAKGMYFEGEGDLLPYRELLFGGFHFRSEARAHDKVGMRLKKRVINLELASPHFYHLDTCFFPLDDQSAFYYPGAFTPAGQKLIKRFVKNPVTVSEADADRFACNAFRVDHHVVLNTVSRELKQRISRLGYQAVETPTSEFVKAGGSVKCLLLRL